MQECCALPADKTVAVFLYASLKIIKFITTAQNPLLNHELLNTANTTNQCFEFPLLLLRPTALGTTP